MQGLDLGKYGGSLDVFKGLHLKHFADVDLEELAQFISQVESSQQARSIWAYLTVGDMAVLDLLTNRLGFEMHRAKGKSMVVIKWLSKTTNMIPAYSLFIVAAGALLIHQGKVFMVQEKGGTRAGKFGLPGGRMDAHQMVHQCVERELYEETGIKAKFKRIVYIRELTHQLYDSVDLYFICLMDLNEQGLESLNLCKREISDYKWVPLEEYEAFTKENSMGTQQLLATEISQLHREGRLLEEKHYKFQLEPGKRSQHTF